MNAQRFVGIAALLTAPLALLTLLAWVNAFANPMMSAFTDSFEVKNATSTPIGVTPLCHFEAEPFLVSGLEQEVCVVPQYSSVHPSFHSLRQVGRQLEPGETLVLLYDGSDFQIAELLIESAGAQPRVMPVDTSATSSTTVYDPTELALAPQSTLRAVQRSGSALGYTLLLYLGGLVPLALGSIWYALRRSAAERH